MFIRRVVGANRLLEFVERGLQFVFSLCHCANPLIPCIKSSKFNPSPGEPTPGVWPTGDGANAPPIAGVIPAPSVAGIGVRDERKNWPVSFSPNLSRTQPSSFGILNVSGAPV